MTPERRHLGHQAREEAELTSAEGMEAARREFESVEAMLRHDAAQHPPPGDLAERVAESVRAEPGPRLSWWQRWFGGGPGAGRGVP